MEHTMISHNKKSSRLGFLAGLAALFGGRNKTVAEDMQKLEFKASTQRIGVSFTDKIRDVFRHKWIKKS
jgi:hypothetical protein